MGSVRLIRVSVSDDRRWNLAAFLQEQVREKEALGNGGTDSDFLRSAPDRGEPESPDVAPNFIGGGYQPKDADEEESNPRASELLQQADDDDSVAPASESNPFEANDDVDPELDRVFAKVGGYEPAPAATAAAEAAKQPAKRKKSVWKSIGGGISRFAKGIGGVVKNLSGYNLIRHGLIGANYNRGQLRKREAKWSQATEALKAHNNPESKAQLIAEMGADGYQERATQLAANEMRLQASTDKARLGLMMNRRNYSGFNMANNFKRAFSDGDIQSRGRFQEFLGAGFFQRKLLRKAN